MTVFNNSSHGVELTSSGNNILSDLTSVNNGGRGLYIFGASSLNNIVSGAAVVNNASFGVELDASTADNTLDNLYVGHNTTIGIYLNTTTENYFTGLLMVGSNGTQCSAGTSGKGLVDTPSACTNDSTVTPQSDASLSTSVTVPSTFVAKVGTDGPVDTTEDAENAEDDGSAGTASYPADPTIFDWLNFESNYRGWGIEEGTAFPASTHQGECASGTCRIWDWSLDFDDTVLRAILADPDDADAIPDGDDIVEHVWDVTSPANQGDCDAAVPGSVFDTDHCENVFLRNAVEILSDGIGNDNALCETDETCLFTPNIGSYQGHGSLQSAGSFVGGALTGITLMEYDINGF